MGSIVKMVGGVLLVSSVVAFSVQKADDDGRMAAVENINAIFRASELTQKKIQAAIADFKSGKITQEEYERGSVDRAWPDFSSVWDDARLIYTTNPKDEHGFMAMKYMLSYGPDGWDSVNGEWDTGGAALSERQQIGDLLLEHHIDHPDLWEVASGIGLPGIHAIPFFEKLYQNSPDENLRATAGLVVADRYADHSTLSGIGSREREKCIQSARSWVELALKFGGAGARYQARAEKIRNKLTQAVGYPIENIRAKTLQGLDDQLSNYQGKVVLIDLWATWCSPCRAAIPELFALNEDLEGRGFQLISISVDDEPQDVIDYIEDGNPMPWVHWHVGRSHSQISKMGISGYPTYFLLDEQGILRAKGNHFGNEMRAELLGLVNQLSLSSE